MDTNKALSLLTNPDAADAPSAAGRELAVIIADGGFMSDWIEKAPDAANRELRVQIVAALDGKFKVAGTEGRSDMSQYDIGAAGGTPSDWISAADTAAERRLRKSVILGLPSRHGVTGFVRRLAATVLLHATGETERRTPESRHPQPDFTSLRRANHDTDAAAKYRAERLERRRVNFEKRKPKV